MLRYNTFLFSMYLNDLENELIQKGAGGFDIGMLKLQSNLVISNSLISNYRLSRSENQVLFYHETMTTGNKIMWKRGAISPLFHIILFIIFNFRSQITYSFVKCGCSIYCFSHSLNSDMSRYEYLEVFQ